MTQDEAERFGLDIFTAASEAAIDTMRTQREVQRQATGHLSMGPLGDAEIADAIGTAVAQGIIVALDRLGLLTAKKSPTPEEAA